MAQIKRINITNVTASGLAPYYTGLIVGIPGHPIEDVRISNVHFAYRGGGLAEWTKNVPPEDVNTYPEPQRFGILPASAFFIRHVKGLQMHHVDVTFEKADARPAFVLDDVQGSDFQHVNVQRFENVPLFSLKGVGDFSTQSVRSLADMRRDKVEKEDISK